MNPSTRPDSSDAPPPTRETDDVARLRRRLARERAARLEAEALAERGLTELYQRQREVRLLESIANAANAVDSLVAAARNTLPDICEYIGWDLGHVMAVGDGDDGTPVMLSTGVSHVSGAPELEEFAKLSRRLRFSRGEGLPGGVWASGEPLWISDLANHQDVPRARAGYAAGLRAAVAFPIQIGEETVGVLEFFSRHPQEPDTDVSLVMRHIGRQLGRVVERERTRARLLHDSLHDPLTQLANRAQFVRQVQHAKRRRDRDNDSAFAVMLLDLDRFKAINDSLGHAAGDEVIVAVASRLTSSLRSSDMVATAHDSTLARMGGDEFMLLLDGIHGAADAIRVAERVQRRLSEPFKVAGRRVHVSASIGIAVSNTGYEQVSDMLRDADIAMHRAKDNGRARYEVFDAEMRERAVQRLQDEEDLRHALDTGQLSLAYQPIVTADGAITAVEALLRWKHPQRGWISPLHAITLAEEIGLIGALGQWVLEQACTQVSLWQKEFDPELNVSINLSAKQLDDVDLAQRVLEVVQRTGIAPSTIKLELTESALMNDAAQAVALFDRLKTHGIEFSLDDFGTGYSSLSQLASLPLDTLKLDRAFVTDIDRDPGKHAIARLIISLARTLGMKVVAEGAETEGEVGELRSLDIDLIQGYYFHRPMAADDVLSLLSQGNTSDASRQHLYVVPGQRS